MHGRGTFVRDDGGQWGTVAVSAAVKFVEGLSGSGMSAVAARRKRKGLSCGGSECC